MMYKADYEGIIKAQEVLLDVYKSIRQIDSELAFKSFIGVLIDSWYSDHDMEPEDASNMLMELHDVHAKVNDELGKMPKSYGY